MSIVQGRFFSLLVFLFAIHPVFGQQKSFSLYLIGDAGKLSITENGVRDLVKEQYDPAVDAAVVFLGDNIYPKGMPSAGEKDRKTTEEIMLAQLSMLGDFKGQVYFVPGNHDWQKDKRDGWQRIRNQQQWVDSLKRPSVHFFPKDGCPGPVELTLAEGVVLVIIDSQWFLHSWDKPEGDDSPCDVKQPEDVALELDDILERNRGKRVIVAAHHPIISHGQHGGVFTLRDHIFPLTSFSEDLYIPLPGLGSIYPLYRKFIGNRQDIAHPVNKQYRRMISEVLEKYPGVMYANGHEHSLEHNWKDSVHYITSGSGVNITHIKKKGYSTFASAQHGLVRVDVFQDGAAKINYFEISKQAPVYTVPVKPPVLPAADTTGELPDFSKTVRVHASDRYSAGSWKKKILGENYRAEWKQDLDVPVFDIGTAKGGLKIVQKGGGMQTLSLRVVDSLEQEYTLRSVEKFPEKAIPEILRKTFAQDLVQDQISAAHPYGALVVPYLSEAAGIYHTNPTLVYIPDDPRLGPYRKTFANTLALFEERPEGDATGKPFFGNAKKIISTDKVLQKLADDVDNRVDQEFVLRARLFDMVIGDWDRHDDQWRWAVFKEKKGEYYRPIPRDRDQAFFLSDGILAKIWSRRWALPKFEGFHDQIRWVPGFMFNARYFDRSFLNGLSAEAWMNESKSLQQSLSDEAITSAIQQFPLSIYNGHGEEIIRKIKSRRDRLTRYALDHYAFLSREVDVPGSEKREWFSVNQRADGNVELNVLKINKRGERSDTVYARTFHPGETNEIRLFGLGGNDVFDIRGDGKKKIKIRVIGGDGTDTVRNQSGLKTIVYDVPDGVSISNRSTVTDRTSTDVAVNVYDRRSFKYPWLAPLVYGNFNYDDGLFLGGGFVLTKHGFRKTPYKSQHLFLASYAPLTNSYNFKYDGRFMQVLGKWGIEVDFDWKAPNYVNNFFGWGNETVFDRDLVDNPAYDLRRSIDYYRIRLQQVEYMTKFTHAVGAKGIIKFGPALQQVEIEAPKQDQRYIVEYAETLPTPLFEVTKNFAGLTGEWELDLRNNPRLTTGGLMITHQSLVMRGIDSDAGNYTSHNTVLSLYHTFNLPAKVTFAVRAGGGTNTGSYELYQAQILDGKTELRGYRKTRFYGDTRFFNNNEVRLKVASFRSYLFPATIGINAFYDVGRVWYSDAEGKDPSAPDGSSQRWHHGWGGGVWFTPFNLTVLSAELAHSPEGNMAYVRLGFLF
jgi:hypothetical protein